MAIGYEGHIKIAGAIALGTGGAGPKERVRLDSSSGYGGAVASAVGLPHLYDWDVWEGSLDFEMTDGVFGTLSGWPAVRETTKSILISNRTSNSQTFDGYWTAISISAAAGAMTTGRLGFKALERASYSYGSDNISKDGLGNASSALEPIPYWDTGIGAYKFIEWTLDLTQDVVVFFACNAIAGPQAPAYLGMGPLNVSLSGSYIEDDEFSDFPGSLDVTVGGSSITLGSVELQRTSDDLRTRNSLTPISVEFAAYELS